MRRKFIYTSMILPPSQRFIAHIDMNSYFASVEQQAHPEWRGRPVCVCAYLNEFGCIIAASREAKNMGVHVGMRVHDVRAIVPNAIFVACNPAKYRSTTKRIFSIFHDYTDRVEHYSIDEAFLDLTGWFKDEISLIQGLCVIKKRIHDEVGEWLTSSIGVGPNKLLAKLASDYQKPDGLTIVGKSNLDDFLDEHELRDIIGIGKRTERRLHKLGIFTPMDFKRASPEMLLRTCGKPLYFIYAALNGLAVDEVHPYTPSIPKSIGHSYCVPKRVAEEGNSIPVFTKLVDKTITRLRSHQLAASGIWVGINMGKEQGAKPASVFERYQHTQDHRERFPEPTYDSTSITTKALILFKRLWDGYSPLSFMAISLWGLHPVSHQSSFKALDLPTRKLERLSKALDSVRKKYGDKALTYATILEAGTEAPDRIGFRKTEGTDVQNPG